MTFLLTPCHPRLVPHLSLHSPVLLALVKGPVPLLLPALVISICMFNHLPQPRFFLTFWSQFSVTFLATLFLLLFISCAIILRSYILRRRYQRNVHSALGAGMLLTPRSPGSRHTRFGHMPKLFDSWLVNGDGGKWQDMSVSHLSHPARSLNFNSVLATGRSTGPCEEETKRFYSVEITRTWSSCRVIRYPFD